MQKSFDVQSPVRLDIQLPAGMVEVDPTLGDRVEVELVARHEEAQALVDAATVELRHGNLVVVDVPSRGRSWNLGGLFGKQDVLCRVGCPEGSGLKVRSRSADVHAGGPLGVVEVATASGDITLQDVRGDLNVKSASGDVSARTVGGRAGANTASGDIVIHEVAGPVSANTASGDISIESAGSDVKANSASGDTAIGAVVRGTVTVNAASGDVHIGVRRGSRVHLDCSTVSGDARSELEPDGGEEAGGDAPLVELKARTVSGDITIARAPAPAGAQGVEA